MKYKIITMIYCRFKADTNNNYIYLQRNLFLFCFLFKCKFNQHLPFLASLRSALSGRSNNLYSAQLNQEQNIYQIKRRKVNKLMIPPTNCIIKSCN